MRFSKLLLERDLLGFLSSDEGEKFGLSLIDCVKSEIYKCTNVEKIVTGVDVLVEMFQGAKPMIES
jgi:hypothetical protein